MAGTGSYTSLTPGSNVPFSKKKKKPHNKGKFGPSSKVRVPISLICTMRAREERIDETKTKRAGAREKKAQSEASASLVNLFHPFVDRLWTPSPSRVPPGRDGAR